MPSAPPTLGDASVFILSHATRADLDRLQEAINARTRTLRQLTAAALRVADHVRLGELKTRYLNGLVGDVEVIDGKSAAVLLDEESTGRLRYDGVRTYDIPADMKRYLLRGIPLGCCKPAD